MPIHSLAREVGVTGTEAARVLERIETLARFSELEGGLTRIVFSAEHRAAADSVCAWMAEAGMDARLDAVGNVVGRYEGKTPGSPCLMFGSHLDSVRDGGKYDGPLGVLAPLACIEALNQAGRRLPFAIEVVGFADEEGVRFQTALLGSRAIAGIFEAETLDAVDADGISVAQAMRGFGLDAAAIPSAARRAEELHGYVEFHIEQGPVLEDENLPVGVVTAISGQTRMTAEITGSAGHAGTVPMNLRRDALAGAAECVAAVERICGGAPGLVGTVGQLTVSPGATNVIAGGARLSLDVRSPDDVERRCAVSDVQEEMADIAARRGLELAVATTFDVDSCTCAPWLMDQLGAAIEAETLVIRRLPSGAGHDGMAMTAVTDIAMLFLRCEGGISHNPAEAVTESDVATGLRVLRRFIDRFEPAQP